MIESIEQILASFKSGNITRREAAKLMAAVALSVAGVTKTQEASAENKQDCTFSASGLNHIGLKVNDVARSRDFYQQHLGLTVIRDNAPGNCFLRCGNSNNYVGLFRSNQVGLDHYCYTIPNYSPEDALEKLARAGIRTRQEENRIYFDDPDGMGVQIAGRWDSWPGPPPLNE